MSKTSLLFAKRFVSHFVIVFFLEQQFLLSAAWAQNLPIVVDGTTNTQVTKTPSGVDQVNIAAPNESGLSHNKFSEYNVNPGGQIINNFSGRDPSEIVTGGGETAVTKTQIGGLVTANPNLVGSGSARVILNEVTSGSVSQLLGYTEIAGTKADLILANPNGIACSGCGFINTARLVMVGGSSNYDASGNLGFNLKEQANPNLYVPLVTVDGLGLDATQVTSTEIIASSVKLLSSIHGNDTNSLTIRTGEGRYDYATKNIAASATSLDPLAPVFAIDASSLAKIQAGRIYLIATKQGVGVKMESEILASSTLNIDANGDVYYSKIAVGDVADLKSSARIEGKNIDAPNLTAQANEFHNLKDIFARNVTIQNSGTLTNDGNIAALNLTLINVNNINNNNAIYGENYLSISGGNLTNSSSGTIYSLNDYTINLSSILDSGVLENSGLITAEKKLTINANQLNNNAEISAKDSLSLIFRGPGTNSGEIIADNILNLTSSYFTNSGNISSDSIDANVKYTLQNDGLIFSNLDSSIRANSLTNAGNIIGDGKLYVNADSFNNSREIYSASDLDVIAREIVNSGNIQSDEKITFNITNLTNSNKIISLKDFEINASGDVENSGDLKSGDDFTVNAEKFTNAAASLILAQNTLTIKATNIDNSNTKPSEKTVNSGIVSVDGIVDLQANVVNNNSGIITGKSTNLRALNATSVNLTNSLGAFINTDILRLNLGDENHTITGTVTASYIDITAANITNEGNVTAMDYIKLNATAGNVTNGFASGDNTDVKLAAGSYVELTASNDINNYGTIVATTDLTLSATAGNVNNYATGKIQGGSGTTTINVLNGSFNNFAASLSSAGLLTSDHDVIFNVKDLNNYGEISVANDLTANVSHDLNNTTTALIWVNNDAKFYVANYFTNNIGEIYANRDLVIQKNLSGDKTSLVQNLSGEIATLTGNITIKTTELNNKTAVGHGYFNKIIDVSESGSIRSSDENKYSWDFNEDGCFGDNCGNKWSGHYAKQLLNPDFISSSISAGNNMTINADKFTNDTSYIGSIGDMSIVTNSFKNPWSTDSGIYQFWGTWSSTWYYSISYYNYFSCEGCGGVERRGPYLHLENYAQSQMSYIKSGGSMTITEGGVVKKDFVNGNDVAQYQAVGAVEEQSHSTNIGDINTYTLGQNGKISVDLSAISNVIESAESVNAATPTTDLSSPVFSGAFKINLDPASTAPLVESRSQFTNSASFFGSVDYFTALGLDGREVISNLERQTQITNLRMLGDSFVETKLILDKLKKLTNNSLFLSKTVTDPNLQVKELLDNAAEEFARLGLNAEDIAANGLSSSKANSLTKDIIVFEITDVQGFKVLAPKIYLSQATRDSLLIPNADTGALGLATNSTIFAKGDLTINAANADFVNNGSITSDGNVNLTVNSLSNKTNSITQAQIIAGNNLTISSVGNIKNLGAKIGAVGNVSLTSSGGDIVNSALVETNDKTLLDANSDSYISDGLTQRSISNTAGFGNGNISSQLLSNAAIKGGAVAINAAQNFNNYAATVSSVQNELSGGGTSSGNVAITAGDDITVSTLELRNRSESSWGTRKKGGYSVTDVTTNIRSDISAEGNITMIASGLAADIESNSNLAGSSILVKGSDITSGNNTTIAAKDDVSVISAINSSYAESGSHKKSTTVKKTSLNIDSTTTNVESNIISGNDLTVTSGGDTLILASNLTGFGDADITAGKYLDRDTGSATYNQEIYNADANVYILNGVDTTYHFEQATKVKTGFDAKTALTVAVIAGSAALTGGATMITAVALGAKAGAATGVEISSNKKTAGSYSEKIVSSDLSFAGNININSGKDITLKAANLEAGINPLISGYSASGGDVNLNAGTVVTNGTETHTNENANVNILSAQENSYSFSSEENLSISGRNINFSDGKLTYGSFANNNEKNYSATQVSSNINSSNGNITILSQNNINLVASNITTDLSSPNISDPDLGNIVLTTQNGNVNILSEYNTTYHSQNQTSGSLYANAEMNSHTTYLSVGIVGESETQRTETGTVVGSNISGSSISINAESHLANPQDHQNQGNIVINSSNLYSTRDDIILASANNINLTTSSNYITNSQESSQFDADVRAAISYNFKDVWKSIENLKDVRPQEIYHTVLSSDGLFANLMKGNDIDESLQGNEKGINDLFTLQNAGKGASGGAGIYVHLEYSTQRQSSSQNTIVANHIFSQNSISLTSGNGWNADEARNAHNNGLGTADINIASSYIMANNNVDLNARFGNINITANNSDAESKSSSFSASLDIPLLATGFGASIGFSDADSSSQTYLNPKIIAGNNLTSNSRFDTNVISSNLIAENVDMTVGGNLNLESKQNTSSSKSISFGLGVNYGGSSGAKGGNISFAFSNSDRAWVDDQASVIGKNSVNVNVNQNTDIKGGLIANITNYELGMKQKDFVDGGNLTINTNTISFSDIYDHDEARSLGIGISGQNRSGANSAGPKNQGSVSGTLSYSMHDYEQTTHATIGKGNIRTGTVLNLDDNTNNVVSVDTASSELNSQTALRGLNRDVNNAQEETKHIEVNPIQASYVHQWGMTAETNQDGKPKSFLQRYLEQINPLMSANRITDGVVTDVRNIVTQLNVKPVALSVGEDNHYRTIELEDKTQLAAVNQAIKDKQEISFDSDEEGNYITLTDKNNPQSNPQKYYITLSSMFDVNDVRQNPNLVANDLSGNGIMNNKDESQRNGLMQLGGFDGSGRVTVDYDPSAKGKTLSFKDDPWGMIKGLTVDTLEVGINYFGAGIFVTKGQAQDQELIKIKTNQIKTDNKINGTNNVLTLSGHSAGGRRNYVTLLNSNANQYVDANGNSVLQVQSYGAPVNDLNLLWAAQKSGAKIVDYQNNNGDFVGNVLGGNGSVLQAGWSALNVISLFEVFGLKSPHSNYYCQGSQCNYNSNFNFSVPQINK